MHDENLKYYVNVEALSQEEVEELQGISETAYVKHALHTIIDTTHLKAIQYSEQHPDEPIGTWEFLSEVLAQMIQIFKGSYETEDIVELVKNLCDAVDATPAQDLHALDNLRDLH